MVKPATDGSGFDAERDALVVQGDACHWKCGGGATACVRLLAVHVRAHSAANYEYPSPPLAHALPPTAAQILWAGGAKLIAED